MGTGGDSFLRQSFVGKQEKMPMLQPLLGCSAEKPLSKGERLSPNSRHASLPTYVYTQGLGHRPGAQASNRPDQLQQNWKQVSKS